MREHDIGIRIWRFDRPGLNEASAKETRLTVDVADASVGRFHTRRNWVGADSDDPSARENALPKLPQMRLMVSAWPTTDERLDAGTTPADDKGRSPYRGLWVVKTHPSSIIS